MRIPWSKWPLRSRKLDPLSYVYVIEFAVGPATIVKVGRTDSILWDTDAHGQPDLAGLAHRVCRETGAEAVICISNRKATLRLVAQLRQRGMTAVGPIWDS